VRQQLKPIGVTLDLSLAVAQIIAYRSVLTPLAPWHGLKCRIHPASLGLSMANESVAMLLAERQQKLSRLRRATEAMR